MNNTAVFAHQELTIPEGAHYQGLSHLLEALQLYEKSVKGVMKKGMHWTQPQAMIHLGVISKKIFIKWGIWITQIGGRAK